VEIDTLLLPLKNIKNCDIRLQIRIPTDLKKNLHVILREAKQNKNKNIFIDYLQEKDIKLQCYVLVKDYKKTIYNIIRPDGLCIYRAFFISNQLKYNRSTSITNMEKLTDDDPDFVANKRSRKDFWDYLVKINHTAKINLNNRNVNDNSYKFYLEASKAIKVVHGEFNDRKDDNYYWNNTYKGTFSISSLHWGNNLHILSATDEKHQKDILWWTDKLLPEEIKELNEENPSHIWILLEKCSKEMFKDVPATGDSNFRSVNELVDALSSPGFHFLMTGDHACPIYFPMFTTEEVKELIFQMLH